MHILKYFGSDIILVLWNTQITRKDYRHWLTSFKAIYFGQYFYYNNICIHSDGLIFHYYKLVYLYSAV